MKWKTDQDKDDAYVFLVELLWWKSYWKNPYCRGKYFRDHLFHLASQIIEADGLHLFLLSDGTWIDDNEYLESLENGTELIICTEEQIQKLSIYFELKRYLSLKNIISIKQWLFYKTHGCFSEITLMFIEAVSSSTSSLVQSVFIVFPYDF